MANAVVTIISTPTPQPGTQVFSHKQIVISDSATPPNTQTQTVDGVTVTTATFPLTGFVAGAGNCTVSDMDTTGAVIGTPVQAAFQIPAPVVNFPATTSVTVSVA